MGDLQGSLQMLTAFIILSNVGFRGGAVPPKKEA